MNLSISLKHAQQLALTSQLKIGNSRLPRGKEGTARAIEHLGYVQIDTISVIERAHHHTLWTRQPSYNSDYLHELQVKDKRIFEYWGHEASYLPMSDYRYYIPLMRSFLQNHPRPRKWVDSNKRIMKSALERIRNEGPLGAKDFAAPPDHKSGMWWNWKPYKVALEVLFWTGELMVRERQNFQRIYDLTERVLPDGVDTTIPDNDELGRFFGRRALSAHGIARENEISKYIPVIDKNIIKKTLNDMKDFGDVLSLKIKGLDKHVYYGLKERIDQNTRQKKSHNRLLLLSPFDNIVINRDRLARLFKFNYAIECYLPAAKRKYGYFCLPILWQDQFIGRLDPKADRKTKIFSIKNLVFEDNFTHSDEVIPPLAKQIKLLAAFNGCEKITLGKTIPPGIKSKLIKKIRSSID